MSCGVGRRCGSDPELLWYRPAATGPIRPLVWEPPYAVGAALKKKKKKEIKIQVLRHKGLWESITLSVSPIQWAAERDLKALVEEEKSPLTQMLWSEGVTGSSLTVWFTGRT